MYTLCRMFRTFDSKAKTQIIYCGHKHAYYMATFLNNLSINITHYGYDELHSNSDTMSCVNVDIEKFLKYT